MTVPPASRPSSTPPSKGSGEPTDKNKKAKKDFNLPKKEVSEEDKKKNLFDLASEEGGSGDLSQEIDQQEIADSQKSAEIGATQEKSALSYVTQLIQKCVAEMKVGQLGGKEVANMKLSAGEVPEAFAGSNLTMSYQENALTIHFDNFMTPQQENQALTLVEKNKDQLLEMVQTLQAKNINVHELSIGKHVIPIPRVEPLPPPFAPTESNLSERRDSQQEQERREEETGPE